MNRLHIDIESYSSVDLKTEGLHKYAASFDFEILLLAYAFNSEPIKYVDLSSGEKLPSRFTKALTDPGIKKYAWNAAFEMACFKAAGLPTIAEQWFCSMIKAAYCGLPLRLETAGKAIGFDEDKTKLRTGKALIRYFCIPCKPTKTNGQRSRNMYYHNPEKWDEFITYVVQDVEAERAITMHLDDYTIPEFERELYLLDQRINNRGVRVDFTLAKKAYSIDTRHKKILLSRMAEITGLENPNSPAQIKTYLSKALKEDIKSLRQDRIEDLISEVRTIEDPDINNDHIIEVLRLRQKSAKTSIKKYVAMILCASLDKRARGLFQFYGANRTGRWAGRRVQLHNLPRNYIPELEKVRTEFIEWDYEAISMIHENISALLSQLIRTAFIASEGHTLAVADFSSIEARVLSWLAGEDWRLDVFKTHGKIYEASASAMFGIPIEDISKDSPERAKGKVAELALGYGGSVGALKAMGGEAMGLTDSEMKYIVELWRARNPKIKKFWRRINNYAMEAVKRETPLVQSFPYGQLVHSCDGKVYTIRLPSGRQLFYQKPHFRINRFGNKALCYMGIDQTSYKWTSISTYGGKITENVTQAIARDLLACAMVRLDANNYDLMLHVHDEAAAEVPISDKEKQLSEMCKLMSIPPPWAGSLPLDADGFTSPFYKK